MSSTNRGAVRAEGDSYQTPLELTNFLVKKLLADGFLSDAEEPRILEPSAGDGNFIESLATLATPSVLVGNEPELTDERRARYERHGAEAWSHRFEHLVLGKGGTPWSAVIGNPPYSSAEPHIRKAMSIAAKKGGVVAFLLRLAFLESRGRAAFWRDHPCRKIYALSERPSFTGGKTDSSAYGFFVWLNGSAAKTELEVMSWRGAAAPEYHREYDVERDLDRLGEALEEIDS